MNKFYNKFKFKFNFQKVCFRKISRISYGWQRIDKML